jgi:hypothetical protein
MKKSLRIIIGFALFISAIFAANAVSLVSLSVENLVSPAYVGQTYSDVALRVTNASPGSFTLNQLVSPSYPAGFSVTANTCVNVTLAQNAYCTVTGSFTPTTAGANTWSTEVRANGVTFTQASSTSVSISQGTAALSVVQTASNIKMVAFTGTTTTGIVTITNGGTGVASNLIPAVAGVPGVTIADNTCTGTLAVDASCTLTLTYVAPSSGITGIENQGAATVSVSYDELSEATELTDSVAVYAVARGYYESLPSFDKASSGIAVDQVWAVAMSSDGTKIYAATAGGLSISTDSGASFNNKTMAEGLGANRVDGVAVSSDGTKIYAATEGGLSISTDSGASFSNKAPTEGLGDNEVLGVTLSSDGTKVYAATDGGISFTIP